MLEGSVRKAGSRVRITGQLVEAATGTHLWADRFEGTLEDVFDLQDRMTASVVAAIEPNVRAAEIQRARRKPVENLQAYDLMLRALPRMYALTRDGLEDAARLLREAIEIDPSYAPALAYLAGCQWRAVSQNWTDRSDPAVAEMVQLARTALAQAPNDTEVLRAAGMVLHYAGGDRSGGIALLNRAIELNPNSANTLQMAALLNAYTGDTQLVITLLERAARLNPFNLTLDFYLAYAISHFVVGQFEATVEWTTKAFEYFPNDTASLRYRAAGLGLLGRVEEGRQVVQRLLALVPGFSITQARRYVEFGMNNPFRPGIADTLYEGLRRCGVPE